MRLSGGMLIGLTFRPSRRLQRPKNGSRFYPWNLPDQTPQPRYHFWPKAKNTARKFKHLMFATAPYWHRAVAQWPLLNGGAPCLWRRRDGRSVGSIDIPPNNLVAQKSSKRARNSFLLKYSECIVVEGLLSLTQFVVVFLVLVSILRCSPLCFTTVIVRIPLPQAIKSNTLQPWNHERRMRRSALNNSSLDALGPPPPSMSSRQLVLRLPDLHMTCSDKPIVSYMFSESRRCMVQE